MGIKGNHWAARFAILTLLVSICTVPQTPASQAVNRCQAIETIAFSSYSGTVGSAQIALTNYKNCLIQQYGSSKASLVPCARYHQIASAFFVLSPASRYLTKALVDYTWCVTGEKSIYESKALTSCDAYLDVVRIALAAGDVALASYARDASSDCQTRTLLSTPTPTATPSRSPTPSPSPTPPALLEMPIPPLPSFSGEVQIGKTITLVWSSPISSYDSVTYLWRQMCTSSTNCVGSFEIPGATKSSYTIQSKDAGYGIFVNILFKKAGYKHYERSMQVSLSVPKPIPTATPTPTKSPTPTPTPSVTKSATPTPTIPNSVTPTPRPTSGIITQPSLVPTPTPSGINCTTNPSPLCGTSGTPLSPTPLPVPTLITSPAPTQRVSFVEVLCIDTYPAGNNPKTLVTATIASRDIESLAKLKTCPVGMSRMINKSPMYSEAGIYLSSNVKQINYAPEKDNASKSGNRLERFIVCKNLVEAAPKRVDIPRTTKVINGPLGVNEVACPSGHSYLATVFYHGYKTINGKPFGGIGGQWPDWTYRSRPQSQGAYLGSKCAVNGQIGFWESGPQYVLVCRPNAKSELLTWTQ